jgi:serine/threonine protein kinase
MEFLEGQTLRERLEASGPLPILPALGFASQIARGLAAAHKMGVVHRDLRAENVFITNDGLAKISDFGISQFLREPIGEMPVARERTHKAAGAPTYMAPEQFSGAVDARADVFSLGVLLYEMVSGRLPFEGASATAPAGSSEPAALPTNVAPRAVEHVIFRCLERKPEARFQTAIELAIALEALSAPSTNHLELLEDALDENDKRRYHAGKLAKALDWSADEMAAYLHCAVATVYRGGGRDDQEALGALASLVLELERLFMYAAVNNPDGFTVGRRTVPIEERRHRAAVWLRTPSRALGDQSPQTLLLRGDLSRVRDFVRSLDQAISA